MKSIKLSVALTCLVLLGISPKESGYQLKHPVPPFVSGAVSPRFGLNFGQEEPVATPDPVFLAQAQEIFKRQCTRCHTARFVWESGMLATEADSLLKVMLAKEPTAVESSQHLLLLEFLKSRLPRE